MSIKDKRLKTEINNVIRDNLMRGYVPTANEVIGELSRNLINNNLTIPSYKFTNKFRRFTSQDLDTAKRLILQDIKTLYSSFVELYQLVEEQISKFTVEKNKYDYRLFGLESQLISMVNKYSSSGYAAGYRSDFSDMESVNLTETTADVDIINHEASLKKLRDIPYTDFDVSVYSPSVIQQNGDINSYLEADGLVWQGIIEQDTQQQTMLTIDIDTKMIGVVNKIDIQIPLLKKADAEIYVSSDADKWIKEYAGEVTTRCKVNFGNEFRYIRIILNKTEADKFILGKYLYYFIVDSIKLGSVNYSLEAEIVSRPICVETYIDKVSIVTEAIIPAATSIDYYVAKNTPAPRWIPISPLNAKNKQSPTVVTFNSTEANQRMRIITPEGVSNNAYELKNLSVNGQRLFAIAEMDNKVITGHKLYKGMDAWKIESLNIATTGPQTQSLFLQNFKDIKVSYKPLLSDKPGLVMNSEEILSNQVMKYSTTITREAGDTIIKERVASSHPVTIYLNGDILYQGTPSDGAVITYPFRKGVNLLEVIINIQEAPSIASLDLNLALFSMGSLVCANRDSMEPVSLFDLRYTTNNQYDVYALHKVGDKYMVIVKDPDLVIRYDFIYDSVVSPVNEILFKAVLKREYPSIDATPRLTAYEIRFT